MLTQIPRFAGALTLLLVCLLAAPALADQPIPYQTRVEASNGVEGTYAPYCVSIETESGPIGIGVTQGEFANVTITLENSDPEEGIGGFDFLFGYDQNALIFQYADEGQLYDDCDWEYFAYRFGPNEYCDTGCPSGIVRVVGLAETNNGPYHPTCFADSVPVSLFDLVFLVSDDTAYECTWQPISFFWMDCSDNALTDDMGYQLFISDAVVEPFTDSNIADGAVGFPTYQGAQDECLSLAPPGKPLPVRFVDFKNGGIDVYCNDSIAEPGDINLNGITFEIADLLLFDQLYMASLGSDTGWSELQMVASDVNVDGIAGSLADLFFHHAAVIGDVSPAAPFPPASWSVNIWIDEYSQTGRFTAPNDVAGVLLVVPGDFVPSWTNEADNEFCRYYDGNQTRMLFTGSEFDIGQVPEAVIGDALFGYSGTAPDIVYAEAVTYQGQVIPLELGVPLDANENENMLPTGLSLKQNYPNPFNPETQIAYSLPEPSFVKLEIYNVTGQRVRTLSEGVASAGDHVILWDGTDDTGSKVASGIYLYRLTASAQVETRKMLMLK